jgi:hypothetical protein
MSIKAGAISKTAITITTRLAHMINPHLMALFIVFLLVTKVADYVLGLTYSPYLRVSRASSWKLSPVTNLPEGLIGGIRGDRKPPDPITP